MAEIYGSAGNAPHLTHKKSMTGVTIAVLVLLAIVIAYFLMRG